MSDNTGTLSDTPYVTNIDDESPTDSEPMSESGLFNEFKNSADKLLYAIALWILCAQGCI